MEDPESIMVLDCRGQDCPMPVIRTKRALDETPAGVLRVLVSAQVQAENVQRAASSAGHSATLEPVEDHFQVTITRSACALDRSPAEAGGSYVVLLTAAQIGPEPQLGSLLAKMFLYTLTEREEKPAAVILMNEAVRLACEETDVLSTLRALEESGVKLLVCGTCLDYFGLLEHKQVGTTSNMYEIVEQLCATKRVISP